MDNDHGNDNSGFEMESYQKKTPEISESLATVEVPATGRQVEASPTTPTTGTESRPNWGRSIEFLLSCISCSVGLGNIWRFPFTAYANGGGAFLIPYIILLLLVGKPMYYMEMVLGQFTSKSSVKLWRVVPLFSGVGVGQMVAIFTIISYYCVILAISLHYFFASFGARLPWGYCKPEWGPQCVDSRPEFSNFSLMAVQGQSSAELYFLNEVTKSKTDISDGIGLPDWRLALWELLTWVIVVAIIIKGVRASGKASYFLAIFPYVVLITILVRAVTLPGSAKGILFFITPQFDKLLSAKVWYAAATQMFFSLNVGMGAIIMFSSYNKFDHNIYRDALIVTVMDTFTSILGGITTFAVLGNLAHNLNIEDIGKVVSSGVGLAFMSYPDALAKIEFIPQLFSVLFFFMLFVLGVGSLVALTNAVATAVWDQYPKLKYWKIVLFFSVIGYLCGLVYVTPGGQWILNLVDYYGGTLLIFILAILELIGVLWIYGLESFCRDVEFMLNRRPSLYWKICWAFVTPVLIIIIFIYSLVTMEPLTHNGREYPPEFIVAGWIVTGIGAILVPLWAVYIIGIRSPYKNFIKALNPKPTWGPADAENHEDWIAYKSVRQSVKEDIKLKHNWSEMNYKLRLVVNQHSKE